MKTYKYWLSCIILLMGITSCTNDLETNMVNDTIGLLNPNLQTVKVYSGLTDVHEIQVIKSGKGNADAQVSISVDKDLLTEYNNQNNKQYALLPADCYSLTQSSLHFAEEDYQKSFTIKWDVKKLEQALTVSPDYVLPLSMEVLSGGVNVDQERISTLLLPTMDIPQISFLEPGLNLGIYPLLKDNDETEAHIGVKLNFNNLEGVSYDISVDPQALEDYNLENFTNYQLLPKAAYEISTTGLKIPANSNEAYFPFTFKKSALTSNPNQIQFGDFVLPLKLTRSSVGSIDPNGSTILYRVTFQPTQLVKTGWTVLDYNTCATEDEVDWIVNLNWVPSNMIDNDLATMWGSKWTTPKPLPYYFVYDMGTEETLYKVGFENPIGENAWRGNAKAGYIEYSLDNETWTKLLDWDTPDHATRSNSWYIPTTKARYIKFVITEAYDSVPPSGGSQMNIAEFNVWI